MSKTPDKFNDGLNLRTRAVTHLRLGSRADVRSALPSDAMAVLLAMSSSPSTAGDALTVLHELQVHQVEVDLQNEELRAARLELETALARQRYFFEHAPVAFLVVNAAGTVHDINRAGAQLLGAPSEALLGQPLTGYLTEPSSDMLRNLLRDAPGQDESHPVQGQLLTPVGAASPWLASVHRDSVPGQFLLVLVAVP